MKKLLELLKLRPSNGDLGVEIECEGENLRAVDSEYWKTEDDGSLRGVFPHSRSEYVMKTPVTVRSFPKALKELIHQQAKAKLAFSFRTSVHVHINVQKLTEDELLAFIYACLLLEEPLMNYCGETRKANRFCLRLQDAEGYEDTLREIFGTDHRAIARLRGDNIRYSAINLHSLVKYGSVEFRGMRGNMSEEILVPWVHTLVHIRQAAKKLGDPIQVHNMFIRMSNEEFARKLMGKHFDKFVYPDLERDMNQSFSLTITLPHVFKGRVKYVPVEKPTIEWQAVGGRVFRIEVDAGIPVEMPQPAPQVAIAYKPIGKILAREIDDMVIDKLDDMFHMEEWVDMTVEQRVVFYRDVFRDI